MILFLFLRAGMFTVSPVGFEVSAGVREASAPARWGGDSLKDRERR